MGRGGRSAYRGFEYQIRVTAWLALEFLIAQNRRGRVEVEPLTGEDLEILRSRDENQETGERRVGFVVGDGGEQRCIVQIKARQGGHWTAGHLVAILNGKEDEEGASGSNRQWPVQIMKANPAATLLFVTDSTVAPGLTWFLAEDALDFRCNGKDFPTEGEKSWGKELFNIDHHVLKRVGVLRAQHYDAIPAKIDAILAKHLHVPHTNREACSSSVIERVREAMLDEHRSAISAEEIRRLAKKQGGLPEGPPLFVAPSTWPTIQVFLRDKHAIVLLGEPGVGKTTAAERLVYEYQTQNPPYREVRPERPSELNDLRKTTEPTIVYVVDPFGRFEPGDHDDEWFSDLESFCRYVRNDLKLVVTSRRTFAERYLPANYQRNKQKRLHRFVFPLEGKAYNAHALLKRHLQAEPGLPSHLCALIESHKARVLRHLNRPMSFSEFAKGLAQFAKKNTDGCAT